MAITLNGSTGITSPGGDVSTADNTIHGVTVGQGGGSVATNTAVGASALNANTTGANNNALGYQALYTNSAGNFNVAVGSGTLYTNNANNNTGVGYQALNKNTTGTPNDAFGYQALYNNTTGYRNTAIGYQSQYLNTTGVGNTAVGTYSLYSNTAFSNTAVGESALQANTTGTPNDAFGRSALFSNTTGIGNVAIGYQTLYNNTTASYNTAIGYTAGQNISTGQYNVLVGGGAGVATTALTTGNSNICIGVNAHTSSAGASNQIVIGFQGVGQGDNYVTLGVGGTNYIYNQFTTNATWTKASDERIKQNIQDLPIGLDFINELKVKQYNWKPNNEYPTDIIGYSEENTQDTTTTMYGMIAQDVKAAMDKLGYEHFGGWNAREADGLQGLSNEMFVLPLINAVKELSAKNAELIARIEALESK